jgi:polar amino acid transport system substrate-binding protein
MSRRRILRFVCASLAALCASGCAIAPTAPVAPEARILAPTGTLRVGVYLGSPTSLVRPGAGDDRGVSVDIGKELARRLGVPYAQVEFARLALVLDALKAGQVDFTVTNATPARAAEMNFTAPLIELELGYLVLPGSRVAALDDVDRPGVKVGVSQGSTSQGTLARLYKNATVVPAASLPVAGQMLAGGAIDAFATNKAILFEMADTLKGARVLDGRWGLEQLAIAVPKGREDGMVYMRRFADSVKSEGLVKRAVERAGLRGTVEAARP